MLVFVTEVDAERQVWKLPEHVLLEFFEPKTTIQLEQLGRIGLSAGEVCILTKPPVSGFN